MKKKSIAAWVIGTLLLVVVVMISFPRYAAPRVLSERKAIHTNLRYIVRASHMLMIEKKIEAADYDQLLEFDPSMNEIIKSYLGENYQNLEVRASDTLISVQTNGGGSISYEFPSLHQTQNLNPNKSGDDNSE